MFGNWIDLIIIFYLLICFASGLKQGLILILINFFAFVFALILAIFTCQYTADFLVDNFGISLVYVHLLSFFINFLIFKILLSVTTFSLVSKYFSKVTRSILNRLLGGVVSTVYGGFVVFLILSIFFALSLPSFFNEQLSVSKFGNFAAQDPLKLNHKLENIFGNILKDTLNKLEFLTVNPESTKKFEINFKTDDLKFDEEAERKMLELVNKERQKQGLTELELDSSIQKVARNYALFMFKNGYISHQDPEGKMASDRLKAGGINFFMSGENIALSENTERAFQGLMASPSHKKNILFPFFRKIGIGAVDGGEFGMLFVQDFTD